MGAQTFFRYGFGADADEAYRDAVRQAKREKGHQEGYAGDIHTPQTGHTVIPESEHKGKQKRRFAAQLLNESDKRVRGRNSPAGAICVDGTKEADRVRSRRNLTGKHGEVWLFFGWGRC